MKNNAPTLKVAPEAKVCIALCENFLHLLPSCIIFFVEYLCVNVLEREKSCIMDDDGGRNIKISLQEKPF